jgi:starch-binding outer membrane protein, SusD/RagB family
MTLYRYIRTFSIAVMLVLICNSSCKKLIEVDPPNDWLESGTVFSSDSMARAAVTGLYSNIMGQTKYFFNGAMSLFPGLSADELMRTSPFNVEDQFASNSLSTANAVVGNNIWKAAYAYLYQCNIILEGLNKSKSVSDAEKKRLAGEVQFVRALCYTYLVNLFGDVPLVTSSNADKNALLPRSSADSVYKLITDDLHAAYVALPDGVQNTRPGRMACQALLARIHLYRKEWANAVSAASVVIGSHQYQISADLNQVFSSASTETIFQWAPVLPLVNSPEGNFFNPSPGSRPSYTITWELWDAFEPDDLRRNNWTQKTPSNSPGTEYVYPYKYKIFASPTPNTPATEYNVVLRLAEQYLIRAEARAQLNNTFEAVADINVIRFRAGLPSLPETLEKGACLTAIEKERRIEFFAEWGHRWIDLKRWQKANEVLTISKGNNWQQTDKLYPIPFSEIERAPNLVQNEGY